MIQREPRDDQEGALSTARVEEAVVDKAQVGAVEEGMADLFLVLDASCLAIQCDKL